MCYTIKQLLKDTDGILSAEGALTTKKTSMTGKRREREGEATACFFPNFASFCLVLSFFVFKNTRQFSSTLQRELRLADVAARSIEDDEEVDVVVVVVVVEEDEEEEEEEGADILEEEDDNPEEEDKPEEERMEGERGRRGEAASRTAAGIRGGGLIIEEADEDEEEGGVDGSGELKEIMVFKTRSKLCSTGDGG